MSLTHGSLFAGIGGFDLGFERAGIKTVWQVEIDPFCRKVLERHWPNVQRFSDIRECRELPTVDVISGGFPCQDISVAGRKEPVRRPDQKNAIGTVRSVVRRKFVSEATQKRRPEPCWIIEQFLVGIGWVPCYESDVNPSRAWADETAKKLSRKYSAVKFRVKKYARSGERRG